jgi:hypothetical protein
MALPVSADVISIGSILLSISRTKLGRSRVYRDGDTAPPRAVFRPFPVVASDRVRAAGAKMRCDKYTASEQLLHSKTGTETTAACGAEEWAAESWNVTKCERLPTIQLWFVIRLTQYFRIHSLKV